MKLHQATIFAALCASLSLPQAATAQTIASPNWKQSNAITNPRVASNLSLAAGMDATETNLYNQNNSATFGTAAGETNGADGKYWATSAKVTSPATLATELTAGKIWIVADLGAAYDLTSIKLWNFQWQNGTAASGNLANRGINQFDVLVRAADADTSDGTPSGTPINLTSVSDLPGAISLSVPFNPGASNPWTVALTDQTIAQAPNTDTYLGQSYSLPPGTIARFVAIRADSFHGGAGIGLGKVRFQGTPAPPSIASRVPADNSTNLAIGANLVATFTENIFAGTGFVTIRITSDNSLVETFDVATSGQLTFSGSQLTINPTFNLQVGVEYYVQIDATAVKNTVGTFFAGITDTTTWSFTTDAIAPTLASTSPADEATNVLISSDLVATFNEPVQAGTGNIILKRTSDDFVIETFNVATSLRISFASNQLTINPSSNLTGGTGYYVQIDSTAVVDLSTNAFAGISDTTTWNFTADGTAPTLTSLSPASPATPHVGTRLLAQFNEPIQAGTGSVTVHKSSDNSVVETIDVTTPGATVAIGGVIAIVRSVTLAPGTAYYVNAPAGAFLDLSGNQTAAISGTSAWTFTTSSAVPLIVENFNGSGASLNATSADVFDAAITTAGGSGTWTTGTGFLENGAVSNATSSLAYLNLGSYLNDAKGTAAGKFAFTLTIAENTTGWIALGLNSATSLTTTLNFTTNNGVGTVIYRGQNSTPTPGELDMFGGFANTNVVDGPDANTGFRTLTVTLDFTGHNGTTNFGSVSWSDSVLGALGSYTFPTNRNLSSLVISHPGTSGTINGLAVYQIPPPANTFASWIGGFSVGGQTGVNGDFDNDDLDNALENLMGTSPEVFNQGLTTVSSSGGNLIFRHTLSATPASDLTGAYEWSTDLATWNASGASAGGTTVTFGVPVIITAGTPNLVEVTATLTGTASPKVFGRFKATQN